MFTAPLTPTLTQRLCCSITTLTWPLLQRSQGHIPQSGNNRDWLDEPPLMLSYANHLLSLWTCRIMDVIVERDCFLLLQLLFPPRWERCPPIGCLLSSLPRPPPLSTGGAEHRPGVGSRLLPSGLRSRGGGRGADGAEGGREIKEAGRSGTLVALYGKINCAASVAA